MFYPVYLRDDKELPNDSDKRLDYVYFSRCNRDKNFDKKTRDLVKRNKGNRGMELYPGTIVEPNNYGIVYQPKHNILIDDNATPSPNDVRYKLCDGTTVFVYQWNGEWRIGSANSWDISGTSEYQKGFTYRDYLDETLTECGLSLDNLDKDEMHTFTFINPRIHLTENDHAIYSFEGFGDKYEQTTNKETFMLFNNNRIVITRGSARKNLDNPLYSKRKMFMSDTYKEGIYKEICNWILYWNIDHKQIYENLNDEMKLKFEFVEDVINALIADFIPREYMGVPVPDGLNVNTEKELRYRLSGSRYRQFIIDVVIRIDEDDDDEVSEYEISESSSEEILINPEDTYVPSSESSDDSE